MKQINETTYQSDNGLITFIQGDCMDVMNSGEKWDLAVVDPPYGIGWDCENPTMSAGDRKDGTKRKMKTWNNPTAKNYKKGDWDSAIPTQEYWNKLFKISKYHIIWGGNYFSEYLKPSGGWIVWEKGVPEGMSLSQAELAWTNKLNSVRITKHLWAGYKKCEDSDRFHPTQKPIQLYRWIFKNYAKPTDHILDTHGGSMSSAIAAHMEGLRMTIVELDPDYFKAALNRFSIYEQQLTIKF